MYIFICIYIYICVCVYASLYLYLHPPEYIDYISRCQSSFGKHSGQSRLQLWGNPQHGCHRYILQVVRKNSQEAMTRWMLLYVYICIVILVSVYVYIHRYVRYGVSQNSGLTTRIGRAARMPNKFSLRCLRSTDCNTLQHAASNSSETATHSTTLHHTAPHCTTLHHTAPHYTTLQYAALALRTGRCSIGCPHKFSLP